MNGKEFENVAHLPPEKRYEYFIKKVADREEVWCLWNDGWALMGGNDHEEMDPVWPHAMFAEASAVGEWLGFKPKKITLDEWMDKWIPSMERDGRMTAVFPTAQGTTTTASPFKLRSDLEEEIAKYEYALPSAPPFVF